MYGISRSTARGTSLSSVLISRRIPSVDSVSRPIDRGLRCSVRSFASCCERSSEAVGFMAITELRPRVFNDNQLLIDQIEQFRSGEGDIDLRYCLAFPPHPGLPDLALQISSLHCQEQGKTETPLRARPLETDDPAD